MHVNAPLTAEGRRRLVARVLEEGRPQAHVAAESRLARATVRKWVTRFLAGGEQALADRSSRPHRSPTRLGPAVVARVEALRRDRKLPPRLIVDELAADGIEVSAATVHRWLRRLGISRLRDLDVTGNSHRQIRRIETDRPGQLVHLDVKKIGAIPTGGGWRVHGRGSSNDSAMSRPPGLAETGAACPAAQSTRPARPPPSTHRTTACLICSSRLFGTISGWWRRLGPSERSAPSRRWPRTPGRRLPARRRASRLRRSGSGRRRGSPDRAAVWWGTRGCRRRSRTRRCSWTRWGWRGVGGCSPITRRGRGRTGRSWWRRWTVCGRGTRWWCGGWTGWVGRCRI